MRKTASLFLFAALAAPACKKETPAPAEPAARLGETTATGTTTTGGAATGTPVGAAPTSPTPAEARPDATGAAPAAAATPPAEAASADEVRPPKAEDLAGYVADLKGKGPLTARFETSLGTINCELHDKKAPITVANFVGLARGRKPFRDPKTGSVAKRPFYDGLTFHRVIPSFMIQGGDPLGVGSGDPGYKFETEVHPELRHDKPGVLAMANAGPNTNGSQFYITELPTAHLDGGYNVFGTCKEVDVVKKIARVEADASRPRTPVVIKKVTILRR